MRALLIGNGDDHVGFDAGFVGQRLEPAGYEFTRCARERPAEWPALDDVDLVLTLGSRWNVYRAETAGLVAAEAALVREVVARDIPLFAVCFGAQVLSHALGGTVSRLQRPEIGWLAIDVEPDAPTLPPGIAGPWMQWHRDVFTVPVGFTLLASSPVGPQLVQAGRSVGTQFHPEVTLDMLRTWADGGADEYRAAGGDPDELLVESTAQVGRSGPATHALVDWFLTLT